MGKNCVVCDYKARKGSSRSLHKFPSDSARKNIWCQILQLHPQTIINDLVCSEHFDPGSLYVSKNRTRLIKGAVPLAIRPIVESDSPEDDPNYTVEDEDKENLHDNVREVRLFKKPRLESPSSVFSINSGKASSSTLTCSETEVEERKLKNLQSRKSGINSPKAKLLQTKLKNAKNMVLFQKKTIRKLKKENYLLRGRLQSLNATFSFLKSNSFLSTSAEKIIDAVIPTTAGAILKRASKGVLKNKSKSLSREKYAPEIRSFALTLSFYSMKSYNYVREKFNNNLPHPATISKWYQSVDGSPGFSEHALVILKRKVEEFTNQKKEVLCNLLMDEMAIMKRVEWNGQKFTGFVDLGSNSFSENNNSEAKNALVYLLVAINDNWKIPVGYFLIDGLTGMERASLTCKLLSFLHVTGVKVTSVTFDGAQSNINMVKCLGADFEDPTELKTSFEHPETKEPVYIFLDPPHMLKLWRNCLAHAGTLTDSNDNFIEWRYFQSLVELQNEEGLHAGTKIRNRHIKFKNEIQKVKIAAQTFSNSVADALDFLEKDLDLNDFKGASSTAEFCRIANNLFDIFNVRRTFSKQKYGKHLSMQSAKTIFDYLDTCKYYILGLKLNGYPLLYSQRKTGFLGFLICIESLKCFYKKYVDVPEPPLNYLLTYKLSQDHIEVTFSAIRSFGGSNNNPTAKQFEAIYKRLLCNTEIKGSRFGNATPLDNTSILNVSSVTTSNLNENLENSDEFITMLNSFDQSYIELFTCYSLPQFSDDVVAYIAGFVVRCLKKCIVCTFCLNLLEQQDTVSLLQIRKTFGKMVNASNFVINICKTAEKYFRLFLVKENLFSKKHTNITTFLVTGAIRNIDDTIFAIALSHSDDLLSDHPLQIIKIILKHYFKLRIHHETFKLKDSKTNRVRSLLTKSVLFKNQ